MTPTTNPAVKDFLIFIDRTIGKLRTLNRSDVCTEGFYDLTGNEVSRAVLAVKPHLDFNQQDYLWEVYLAYRDIPYSEWQPEVLEGFFEDFRKTVTEADLFTADALPLPDR